MTVLIVTRGLPAAGKTTRARNWVAEAPLTRARVNRDDLRTMLFGGWTGLPEHETAVTAVQHAAVYDLLRFHRSVVVDDTNLDDKVVHLLRSIAADAHAAVEVWDLRDTPVEVCVQRDAERATRGERAVGEAVIRNKAAQYLTTDMAVNR